MRWRSQVAAADDVGTHMEGEDANATVSVILENKFDAALTPNQPGWADPIGWTPSKGGYDVSDARQHSPAAAPTVR